MSSLANQIRTEQAISIGSLTREAQRSTPDVSYSTVARLSHSFRTVLQLDNGISIVLM